MAPAGKTARGSGHVYPRYQHLYDQHHHSEEAATSSLCFEEVYLGGTTPHAGGHAVQGAVEAGGVGAGADGLGVEQAPPRVLAARRRVAGRVGVGPRGGLPAILKGEKSTFFFPP